jgi:hypothetical protein
MDAALDAYHAMRELVLRHPGARAGDALLASLRTLCRAAASAAADAECAARLAEVEESAMLLFSGTVNANWARRRILAALEHFRARLQSKKQETTGESGGRRGPWNESWTSRGTTTT